MSRLTSEELRKRRQEFQDQAGEAFDQMLGSDGQNGLVTFEDGEERACDLGDGLTRRLLEEHLAADAEADPEGELPAQFAAGRCIATHRGRGGTGDAGVGQQTRQSKLRACRPPVQALPPDFFPSWMSDWHWAARVTAPAC